MTTDCIFCKIVAGEIPCFQIYEDEQVLAFADINPVVQGHTLVIPKAHHENLFEMTPQAIASVHQASQKVAVGIRHALGCPGLTVLQLNGRAANQVIMHYHVHLIPRDRSQDGLDKLEWEEPQAGDMAALGEMAAMVKAAL